MLIGKRYFMSHWDIEQRRPSFDPAANKIVSNLEKRLIIKGKAYSGSLSRRDLVRLIAT